MQANSQLKLPFESTKEQDRLNRVERLLGGKLRGKVRRASELAFNYKEATKIATGAYPPVDACILKQKHQGRQEATRETEGGEG